MLHYWISPGTYPANTAGPRTCPRCIPCILSNVTTTTSLSLHPKNNRAIYYSYTKLYALQIACSDMEHFDAFDAFFTDALVNFGSGIQVQHPESCLGWWAPSLPLAGTNTVNRWLVIIRISTSCWYVLLHSCGYIFGRWYDTNLNFSDSSPGFMIGEFIQLNNRDVI